MGRMRRMSEDVVEKMFWRESNSVWKEKEGMYPSVEEREAWSSYGWRRGETGLRK